MRTKCGLRFAAAAFLSVLVCASPALATDTRHMCDDGKIEQQLEQEREAALQQRLTMGQNVSNQYPLLNTSSSCMQNLMNMFSQLPSLSDPLNIASAIFAPLLQQVMSTINQTCSQVMNSVSSAQNSTSQLAKICMPTPTFNLSIDLPTFNVQGCSGGTQIPLTNGFSSPSSTSFNWTQFQAQ